ncbi:MmcQ/YjbR family DNA-binding protein [Octadecabacter sp. G9-8]|uniref:MmcQ/YjbR family DNA-binding protein n=1 Tax=Octadecabacter dasysiphoniae TaxID=2909341 RepID=A0ABS9D0W7_9RHOB|nr:MmcQ/YjbR family DNA-binding protein [Octadecabacter dasysiphoniae]MCF2872846.1 MmcQ/YjbR family DNA-binding protein [Octadecabacter dasysiphoniae]
MSRDLVNQLCKSLPAAERSDPWGGHDTWKIAGKMFANIGSMGHGISLKTASVEQAHHLQDMFGWPKAPYMHRSWVQVPFETDAAELRFRIETSYAIIRAALPAKTRKTLPDFTPTDQS